jgi:hypothetical protein
MAKYVVIICLAFLIPAVLVDQSPTVALESPPVVKVAGDCPCGSACPCRTESLPPVADVEPASPSDKQVIDDGLPKIGSRRMLNGIEQELTRVERIGDRVRYYFRPVRSTVTRSSGGLHWSYPGEIRQHLASGHGVNASGMSREEAESLHDSLHNAERGVRVQQPTFYQPETSGCPGGVCPSPVQRRTFFRR